MKKKVIALALCLALSVESASWAGAFSLEEEDLISSSENPVYSVASGEGDAGLSLDDMAPEDFFQDIVIEDIAMEEYDQGSAPVQGTFTEDISFDDAVYGEISFEEGDLDGQAVMDGAIGFEEGNGDLDAFIDIEEEDLLTSSVSTTDAVPEVSAAYTRLAVTVYNEDWAIYSYGYKLRRKNAVEVVYAGNEDPGEFEEAFPIEEADLAAASVGAGNEDGSDPFEGTPFEPAAGPESTVIAGSEEAYLDEINFVEDDAASVSSGADLLSDGLQEEPVSENVYSVGATAADIFYTSKDGVIRVTTIDRATGKSHTGYYLFDDNGKMLTGRRSLKPGTPGQTYNYQTYKLCMFTPSNVAKLYDEYAGQNVILTPLNSDIGQRKDNYWYWDKAAGKFQYFDNNGNRYPMNELNAQYASVGYFNINGKSYQLMSSGRPRTGLREINGNLYFFRPDTEIPGEMLVGSWMKLNSKTTSRYLYFQGYEAGDKRGQALKHTGYHVAAVVENGYTYRYLLNKNGYLLANKLRVKAEDGGTYCSGADARVYTNTLLRIGDTRYYFGGDGKQASWQNQWIYLGGSIKQYYYFGANPGQVEEKTGIQKVTVNDKFAGWFYFPANGNHVKSALVDDRYYDSVGRMVSAIQTVNGKTYFFRVSNSTEYRGTMYKETLIHYQDKYYYATADGTLFKEGSRTINGKTYFFKDYVMLFDTFTWNGSTYGYVNKSGTFVTGWVVENDARNLVRYVNPAGGGFYKSTSANIGGLIYYFDANGYRRNDVTDIYTGPYYLEVDRVNGVMTVYNSARTVPVKSIRVSVGLAGTETPLGTFYLTRSDRWQALMGPSWGQYGTHVYEGIFIHSVACTYANSYNVPRYEYNKLGSPASHGCIRCCVADAKWVWENCNGARIRVFDGSYTSSEAFKGPLGRRALVPMPEGAYYDPTDPAVVG